MPDERGIEELERELQRFIVESLMLNDVEPDQIQRDAPLFGDGLGLDSIDALQLAMGLTRKYGVQMKADDQRNKEIFRSVRTLAAFIAEHREAGPRS